MILRLTIVLSVQVALVFGAHGRDWLVGSARDIHEVLPKLKPLSSPPYGGMRDALFKSLHVLQG